MDMSALLNILLATDTPVLPNLTAIRVALHLVWAIVLGSGTLLLAGQLARPYRLRIGFSTTRGQVSHLGSALDPREGPRFVALPGGFTTKEPCSGDRFPVRGVRHTQGYPAAHLNRRFDRSPVDALINLIVGCRLRSRIPVRLDLHPVTHLRITVLPQRWPRARWLCSGPGSPRRCGRGSSLSVRPR